MNHYQSTEEPVMKINPHAEDCVLQCIIHTPERRILIFAGKPPQPGIEQPAGKRRRAPFRLPLTVASEALSSFEPAIQIHPLQTT
jgi:hypothetical protein